MTVQCFQWIGNDRDVVLTFDGNCAKTFAPMFGVVFCGQYYSFLHPDLLLKKYFRGSFFLWNFLWKVFVGQ